MQVKQLIGTTAALAVLAVPAAQAMPLSGDEGAAVSTSQAYVPFVSDFDPSASQAYVPFVSDFGPAGSSAAASGIGVGDDTSFATAAQSQANVAAGLRYQAMAASYASSPGSDVRPDDRSGVRGVVPTTPVATVAARPGTDWTWIGAGSGSGLLLLVAGGLFLLGARRHGDAALPS